MGFRKENNMVKMLDIRDAVRFDPVHKRLIALEREHGSIKAMSIWDEEFIQWKKRHGKSN